MTTTEAVISATEQPTTGNSRRLLLSCPGCGNSRAVTQVDEAPVGTLAMLRCSACSRTWSEIIAWYSRMSDEDV